MLETEAMKPGHGTDRPEARALLILKRLIFKQAAHAPVSSCLVPCFALSPPEDGAKQPPGLPASSPSPACLGRWTSWSLTACFFSLLSAPPTCSPTGLRHFNVLATPPCPGCRQGLPASSLCKPRAHRPLPCPLYESYSSTGSPD